MSVIELRDYKGTLIPVLFCEQCHKPIVALESAMLFDDDKGNFKVCRKVTCDPGWKGSIGLESILAQLVNNYMGLDMKIDDWGFPHKEIKPLSDFEKFVESLTG